MSEPALPSAAVPLWRGMVVLFVLLIAVMLPVPLSQPADGLPTEMPAAIPPAVRPLVEAVLVAPPVAPAPSVVPEVRVATPRRLAADEAEVCGMGVVRVDDQDPLAQHRIPDGVRALALQRLGLVMASSRDERFRAAERLLSARLAVAPDAIADAADGDAACRRARDLGLEETTRFCVEDQARSQAALLEPAAMAIDQLARMAALSTDPQVYAFAFEACRPRGLNFVGRDGNCQLVSAEQWARLAPDDAAPWLELASQAFSRGDAAAANSALARAAEAKTIGVNAAALAAIVASALPEGMPMLEQTAVQAEIAGLEAHAKPAGLDAIDKACSETALGDTGRHSLCDALARMLVERGSSSGPVTAGVQLGERLGWPAERTSAILQEQRAALDATLRFTDSPQALACDSLQRRRELALMAGSLGNLGAGHELLRREASGRMVERRE